MRLIRPDAKFDAMSIDTVEKISVKLANDIEACVERYLRTTTKWNKAPSTIRTQLTRLIPRLEEITESLPPKVKRVFIDKGLDALKCETTWAHINEATLRCGENRDGALAASVALHTLNSIYQNKAKLIEPSRFILRGGETNAEEMYKVSAKFLLDYKTLIIKADEKGKHRTSGILLKHSTYQTLQLLIEDKKNREILANNGFDSFALYPRLLDKVKKNCPPKAMPPFQRLLEEHDSDYWGKKKITLLGHITELDDLYQFSSVMFEEIESYAANKSKEGADSRSNKTLGELPRKITNAVFKVADFYNQENLLALKTNGFKQFANEDYRLLVELREKGTINGNDIGFIRELIRTLYPTLDKEWKTIIPYQLSFHNKYAERPIFADFSPIKQISMALYKDLEALLAVQKELLDEKNHAERTLYTNYLQIKAAFVLFKEEICAEHQAILNKHGLKAFNLHGHELQKTMFMLLQNASKNGTLKNITAYGYRKSIEWLLRQLSFDIIEAFPISTSKTEKHLKKLNSDDYYSAEQCRELAYYIEKNLMQEQLSVNERMSLIFARILLKTGWNLSPALDIECDDIVRSESPLNPNGGVHVVLQKARAGYKTTVYNFMDPAIGIASIQSAASDLLYIRDVHTKQLRASVPESNIYKNYVFLIEDRKAIQRLSAKVVNEVTRLTRKLGCEITFDSKKIRKGGMNHLYRKVQKNLQDYEEAAKHSFEIFESHYLRIDENQSRYTLNKAVKVMGQYFTGREISKEIVIITEPKNSYQVTPSGTCASDGEDEAAKRYNTDHKKLHAEKGRQSRFCADFLSCVWCKFYRAVADPEHVWKLLSYKEYVLKSMEVSAVAQDETDEQRSAINILKWRVGEIIEQMNSKSPGILEKGVSLLNEKGMHPDWQFALPDLA